MQHQPVLVDEVIECLRPSHGEAYLDLTAGYGGHARAILEHTNAPKLAVLVDRDPQATERLRLDFDETEIRNEDFLTASQALAGQGRRFDLVLADLGLSSPQLDEPQRGFSFQADGPLDMRMDGRQTVTAQQLLNEASPAELEALLRKYGEEPKAKQIARAIVDGRPLSSTAELAAIARRAWPGRSRTHPATRTFQALRMAVNDELKQLEDSLPLWLELLAPDGRLAVISFHSHEDRLVKDFLAEHSGNRYDAELRLLTKRPCRPSPVEIANNPRARSAKLRAAVKIKT